MQRLRAIMIFQIMIHNSYDNADSNAVTKLVQARSEAYLSISPESTYSTPDVFDLPPETRSCLQPKERQMVSFERYSYVNCIAECRSAMVNELCGCVPYTLPNNNGSSKKFLHFNTHANTRQKKTHV